MFIPEIFTEKLICMAGNEIILETNIKDDNDIIKLKDHFTTTSFASFTVMRTNYKQKGHKEIEFNYM